MNRYFLIGYMGSGKSTFGRLLAGDLGLSFVDMDVFIEAKYQKTIADLFEEKGEEAFRVIERDALHEVAQFENCLISTGGGTPCFFDNMDYMNQNGETLYLRTSVTVLADRLKKARGKRPLLQGKTDSELEQHIADMLRNREPYYLKSRYILDTDHLTLKNLRDRFLASIRA